MYVRVPLALLFYFTPSSSFFFMVMYFFKTLTPIFSVQEMSELEEIKSTVDRLKEIDHSDVS